ncbi:MFS transporter [Arthrobacter cupressi]|uniref:Sugar phosphate permease n=1 Tax=Arthrobacter cupressi TaxID=1045773 RepID=A0A1G8K0X7_9MICC|nr:MFS transporter [Arthrobacter cupressi]NYD77373.1 sugar phosphate permease [Arthrobacter cupressi]SDI37043.1 Sugar phosphate permease [Arthrobacter cupressi]
MPQADSAPIPESTLEERNRTFRRIVFRILPFATIVYILAWLDRVNVGFAKLTMLDDLGWSDAIYGAGAGIFFLGYFLFEVPSNLLLQKIGAPKTIMRIAIGWGVVSVLMAFCTEPWHFYVLRFLQGAFEAGLHPGLILFLTFWLPAHRRARSIAIFMSASPIALLMGSPLAALIMTRTDGAMGMADWQWLFIIEGFPSIVLGILAVFVMTDKPANAKWLSAKEREHVSYELDLESAAESGREHKFSAALRTRTVWVLILTLFCIICGNATLSFYGPSLMSAAGFTDLTTIGWIMSGIFVFGWGGMILNGWLSDRRREARWHAATAAGVGALGLVLAAVAQDAGSAVGVILALALSAAGTMGSIPVFWSLPPRFMSGTALAAGLALINSIANLAGYFAPQFLGAIKTGTGSYSSGLFIIAAVEFVAVALILAFIRKDTTAAPAEVESGTESRVPS